MQLHEILREVHRRLGDIGRAHVSIARRDVQPLNRRRGWIWVWRFSPAPRGTYEVGFRHVVPDDAPAGTPRFVDDCGRNWSSWISIAENARFGFSPEDVLATDWEFVE